MTKTATEVVTKNTIIEWQLKLKELLDKYGSPYGIEAEIEKYKGALLEIKNTQGKVCEDYENCKHASCKSSYDSWFIADKALKELKEDV